ncbi:MAG TPA: RagB/SusD family nutrient uptake outer membrane protein [Puia sp.]|jgi:hypothetical protein
MIFKNLIIVVPLFAISILVGSCRKLVEVSTPATSITGTSAYNSDATSIAVLTGLYEKISTGSTNSAGKIPSLTLYTGLSSDELTLWSGSTNVKAIAYYKNALTAGSTGYGSEFWIGVYPYIFSCNAAIEGLTGSNSLTPVVKQQLLGEAMFMRAFYYFYLINLYGNIPLPLGSDYKINATLAPVSVSLAYKQVIADLQKAESLLSTVYLDATLQNSSAERVRPTKWAAAALLARVYLYNQNWAAAESQADSVIGNTNLFQLSSLKSTFLKASLGNNEAIWQLQPVNTNWNTEDAKVFIMSSTGPGKSLNFGAYLSNNLLNSFEAGDQRRFNRNWIDSIKSGGAIYYFPYKYKINTSGAPVNEYLMMLRLGELYLVRAEARAQQGNTMGAASDLNSIRNRAGLGNTSESTQEGLIANILHEKQVELFAELGQRWLELKRTGSVNTIMAIVTSQKGGTWQNYQQLYPVWVPDIQADPNLKQNTGY